MEGLMKTTIMTLATFAALTLTASTGAHALPVVGKGDLNRHCVAKYQPRGIQAMADPYTAPLSGQLRCRLTSIAGFTNENQSNGEVCRRLTGNARWSNQGNRVRCGGAGSAGDPLQCAEPGRFQPLYALGLERPRIRLPIDAIRRAIACRQLNSASESNAQTSKRM